MSRPVRSLVALGLIVSLTGCLGTIVQAPTPQGASYGDTRAHLIGSSTEIDARDCKSGLQQVVDVRAALGRRGRDPDLRHHRADDDRLHLLALRRGTRRP